MIKGLLYFLGAVAVVYGQSCDIAAIHTCMKPDEADLPNGNKMQEMKQQGEQCFTNAGCKVPQAPQKNANMEEMANCFKQVHESAQSDIETCVKAKFPNFNFPAFNQSHGWHHGPMEHHGGPKNSGEHGKDGHHENPMEHFIQKALNESCPDDASRTNAKTCLKGLFTQAMSQMKEQHAGGFNFTNIKAKMCEKKKKCFDTLSADCQTELKNVKAQVCTCVKSEVADKGESFKTQIKACLPTRPADFTTPSSAAVAASNPKFGARKNKEGEDEHEEHAKNGFQGVQSMVDMICAEERDPCAA